MSVTCDNYVKYETHSEVTNEEKDPLGDLEIYEDNIRYYRLNEKVFAEPITVISENIGNEAEEDSMICFVDNLAIKKTTGKRNKYLIDVDQSSSDLKCPQTSCTKTFSTPTHLRAHIRRVHCAEHTHVCEQCGATFSAGYLLRRHVAVHGTERTECPVCGKMLSKRTNMSLHVRTHAGARPHACAVCRRAFVRHATLRTHERLVHRAGDTRPQRFSSRKLLMKHKSCPK